MVATSGLRPPAFSWMFRKISSPSRPAHDALDLGVAQHGGHHVELSMRIGQHHERPAVRDTV